MRRQLLPLIALAVLGCSPATISRIGPPIPPRAKGCDVQILEKGEKPSRPYRDVGMVTLENCQDYRTPPCKRWLEDAACELGGSVAYEDENQRPQGDIVAPMTYRVLVAAYVADLAPGANDPVMSSRPCIPPCLEGERCVAGRCVRGEGPDCDEPEAGGEEVSVDKCVE